MKELLLTIGLLGVIALSAAERYVPEYLNKISVTVRAEAGYSRSEGSGTLYTRKVDGKQAVFAFTAGHVVEGLRNIEERIVAGKPIKHITFENPKLIRELRNKDGRRTGEIAVDAKVIRYSPANKHDLALLLVLSEGFKADETVEFYPKDAALIRVGTHVNHTGSFLGSGSSGGHNSFSEGVLSAHGRILFKQPFCQTTAPAYPGSSGGIMANDKGQYIGMLVRGAGSDYNLSVPVARMWKWAEDSKVEWAMNPNLPVSMKEIEKLPIEGPAAAEGEGDGTSKMYPFLIKRTKVTKE
jgi:S1-C subfamily serine protease